MNKLLKIQKKCKNKIYFAWSLKKSDNYCSETKNYIRLDRYNKQYKTTIAGICQES